LVARRDNSLPFGPSLAAGALITYTFWDWLRRTADLQMFLFSWKALLALTLFAAVFLFASSLVIRTARPSRGQA
jgi:hypothetical protein